MAATAATKAELAAAVKLLNERITSLVTRCNSLEAAGQVNAREIAALKVQIAELEKDAEPEPTPEGKVLFFSDFSSFDGWYVQSLKGRATITAGWGRFEVRPGDVESDTGSNRSEVSGPTFNEGEEIWVRDVFRLGADDTGTPKDWLLLQQFHETDWSGSPANGVLLDESGRIRLGNKITFWQGPKIVRGVTYELTYRLKLSQGTGGEVEPYWNGEAEPTYKGRTMFAGSVYLKAGIYRSPTSTGISVVEHDEIVVATAKAAALAP